MAVLPRVTDMRIAIFDLGTNTFHLLIADCDGRRFHVLFRSRRTVKLGRRASGQVEVLAGLRAGEKVLISQPPSNAMRLALP